MASKATDALATVQQAIAHRVASRDANELKAGGLSPGADEHVLVELACECTNVDCRRSIQVSLDAYRRMLEAGNQYVLRAGHHAFTSYRTIVAAGLMRVEERV